MEMPPGCPAKKKWKETKEKMMDTTARALKAVADGGEKKGLLKFFRKETEKEHEQRIRRERTESDLQGQKEAEETISKAGQEAATKEKERFDAKMRKRKSRGKYYEHERAAGLRDNNMRLKRRRVSSILTMKLLNHGPFHGIFQVVNADLQCYSSSDANIAEMSRPAHEIREWYKAKERKHKHSKHNAATTTTACSETRMKKRARYVNWITPFCWTQIQLAGRKTKNVEGLSPSGIVRWLHCFDNSTFCRLSKSTVAEWIEKRDGVRVWKETILSRAKRGNIPGHDKGGCRGVLVKWPNVQRSKC
jgi:hypothetical protein